MAGILVRRLDGWDIGQEVGWLGYWSGGWTAGILVRRLDGWETGWEVAWLEQWLGGGKGSAADHPFLSPSPSLPPRSPPPPPPPHLCPSVYSR